MKRETSLLVGERARDIRGVFALVAFSTDLIQLQSGVLHHATVHFVYNPSRNHVFLSRSGECEHHEEKAYKNMSPISHQ